MLIIGATAGRLLSSTSPLEFVGWLLGGLLLLLWIRVRYVRRRNARLREDIRHVLWKSYPIGLETLKLSDKLIAHRLAHAPKSMQEVYARKRWKQLGIEFLGYHGLVFMSQLDRLFDEGTIVGTIADDPTDTNADVIWEIAPVTPERGPWGFRPQMMTNEGGG